MYAIVDRVIPTEHGCHSSAPHDIGVGTFIPSIDDQKNLMKELTFIFSTSVIENHPELQKIYGKIYPKHLEHKYSHCVGNKTKQYPLGLFDCNENKTPFQRTQVFRFETKIRKRVNIPCIQKRIILNNMNTSQDFQI